ncbi:MAG: TetR/AcrR family transcriptional regulator [Ancrocorticia sp.]|uniref:TetR/AcrR family transcriptional regulator n=1 Tax=Ancrocorticia sp. TaxID=2593684 RepID=UPI003F90657C
MARRVDPERVARKREQIIVEAARLFAAQSYERTSVSDIARGLGISQATIFYYFGTKDELFRAIFERDLPVAQELIVRHIHAEKPVPAILDILGELAKDASDPSATGMVVELFRRVHHDPELITIVEQTADVITQGLATLINGGIARGEIDSGLDPIETARWLQAIVDGAYLNARSGYSPVQDIRRTARGYLAPVVGGRTDD